MSLAKASTAALVGLACVAVAGYAVSERSVRPVHADAYRMKVQALHLMQRAERAIADAKRERGIAIDARNDPDRTGIVGPQFSLVTTDRGSQAAKALAAHPNFAAAITQMLLEAGVRDSDLVAVGMTGSLPGLNLAVFAACRAIGAEPIAIASVGASMFGATDPGMTWLDMEEVCVSKGLWPFHSIAASLGGGGDVGRGLSPAGRQLLADAIERHHAALLDQATVLEAVQARVALYDSIARVRGRAVKVYVNVGGGIASLGGSQNGHLIPPGLTRRLKRRSYPNHGVINVYADRGLPVIHLLQVERLARAYSITDESGETVKPGRGLLFIRYRYNLWIVGGVAAIVLALNFVVLRLDLRHKLLGQPHPERNAAP
jgi:poly-gamma-glutamate system protein